MATTEERLKILNMIEEGKISADEGSKLLAALTGSAKRRPAQRPGANDPRQLRVRVSDIATGRAKVNINLPIGLVNVGLQIGAHYIPEVEGFNMEELAEAIQTGVQGKIVDVIDEEDGERIGIYVE